MPHLLPAANPVLLPRVVLAPRPLCMRSSVLHCVAAYVYMCMYTYQPHDTHTDRMGGSESARERKMREQKNRATKQDIPETNPRKSTKK